MIEIVRYRPANKKLWDDLITSSKNGVFLFYRDYMEYHADRFNDYSLLFFTDKDELIALMPANIKDDTLYSHGGLTFGGVVSNYKMKTPIMMEIFDALIAHLREVNIGKIAYKVVPHIYHTIPSQEDLYALFRYNAKLIRRDVSSAVYMPAKGEFQENRVRTVNKALKEDIVVERSHDFRTYMRIVEEVLMERHEVRPVHTHQEIEMLASRFPHNIKLFVSNKDDTMLAGTIIYESKNVAHAQYIANSNDGRKVGALDIIFDHLINNYYRKKRYFDFGISTEKDGHFLNRGLIAYKEAFAARAVAYDFYEMST